MYSDMWNLLRKKKVAFIVGFVLAMIMSIPAGAVESHGGAEAAAELAWWSVLPFVGILLSIAILPVAAQGWWHRWFPMVSLAWAVPTGLFLLFISPAWILHTAIEYISFILLIGSLYVISGGIYIKGRLGGTPISNTAVLGFGCIIANLIGTTGASMILIRPLLRANSHRRNILHIVVFFIFLVSNIGGCLTPLGDPPLFLGFLSGVPFSWTFTLFPAWILTCGLLLIIFFILDAIANRKESPEAYKGERGFVIEGKANFVLLAGVMGVVILYSRLPHSLGLWRDVIQWALMGCLAGLSWRYTPKNIHIENEFKWFPIREVAILFAGIFVCMIPALQLLRANGQALGVVEPRHFFWATGIMSAVLDNAPSYLVFLNIGVAVSDGAGHIVTVAQGMIAQDILKAVSLGAVFMGALTYIGNGPNFMVKSISSHMGFRTPGFFGYMGWSFCMLTPVFLLVSRVFF